MGGGNQGAQLHKGNGSQSARLLLMERDRAVNLNFDLKLIKSNPNTTNVSFPYAHLQQNDTKLDHCFTSPW